MAHNQALPRILHVCSDTNIGGAGRYILTLLTQRQIRERFAVALACPEGGLAEEARRAGIDIWPAPGADASLSLGAVRTLTSIMRQWRPRVVHTHGSLAGRIAGTLTGARVVYTKHGLASETEQAVQIRSPGGLLQRAAVRTFAHRIVGVSEAVGQRLIASGADPERLRVIPGGVDLRLYAETGPLVPGVIGTLGRLEREKGFDCLLEALSRLHPEGFPDDATSNFPINPRLLLGGDGSQRERLTQQAEALGLQERVTLTGFVPDVAGFLGRIGLFVLPSRSEGLGLVLVEAMAAGRPVVATRVGGIPEVVVHGETGLLVPPDEPYALAEAISSLLSQPELAGRMGEAGRRRAARLFSAECMASQTVALYDELIPHVR